MELTKLRDRLEKEIYEISDSVSTTGELTYAQTKTLSKLASALYYLKKIGMIDEKKKQME